MTSRRTKRLLKNLNSLPLPSVRPSRNGYWVCPSCNTINHTSVLVMPNVDGESKSYVVPDRVSCRGLACSHTFDTLAPLGG